MNIASENVSKVFFNCYLKNKEEHENEKNPIIVEGIVYKYSFNPIKIEENKDIIISFLQQISKSFYINVGEGDSFLNFCKDKNGELWTTSHEEMEQLMLLGMAIDKIEYCFPREIWISLPGNMPYLVIV